MSETQLHIFRKLLRELAELAEHASLTGAMSGGQETAVRRYNQALETLEDEDAVPHGLFSKLKPNTSFDELAVEAKLLLASLEDDGDEKGKRKGRHGVDFDFGILMGLAPFTRGEDLANLVEEQLKSGAKIPGHVLVALAPFLPGEMITKLVKVRLNQTTSQKEEPQSEAEKKSDVTPDEHEAASTELASYLDGDDAIDRIMGDNSLPAEAKLELIRKALDK